MLANVACSGATTSNILEQGQHGFLAQIQAVTPDTRLVTVLIGGNDVFYVGNLDALTCQDMGGSNCKVVPDTEVDRRICNPGCVCGWAQTGRIAGSCNHRR